MSSASPPFAVANATSNKDEDFHATRSEGQLLHGFGIFDGHGGRDCAKFCAAEESGILSGLLRGATALPDASKIADVFWSADAKCGPALAARGGHGRDGGGAHAGSTATVLLVERVPETGSTSSKGRGGGSGSSRGAAGSTGTSADSFRCLLAWVGDSSALTVDMTTGKIGAATVNHTPDNAVEASNLRIMAKAGKELPKGASRKPSKPGDAEAAPAAAAPALEVEAAPATEAAPASAREPEDEEEEVPVTAALVGAALKKAGVLPTATCPQELLLRAFVREQLIFSTIPKGRKYRRNACVFRRPRQKDENMPLVVATHEDPYSSHYRDLLMTRSICDWTKSAWVLPHPEVVAFNVTHGSHVRAVLASDGLWDICSADEAATILRAAATPQEAAQKLLEAAKAVYIGERGLEKMGDDTTVMVVDLLPGGPVTAAQRAKAGGCVLS